MTRRSTRPSSVTQWVLPPKPKLGVWIDDCSSRSDSSEIRIGSLRVVVVRGHIDFPKDQWVMNAYPELFTARKLESKDMDGAKAEALKLVKAWCESVQAAIRGV